MEAPKPKFRLRWYHLVIGGVVIVALLCVGGIALVVTSPQFSQATQNAGQSLGELSALQTQIAKEYQLSPEQVGVFINFVTTSSGGAAKTTRRLTVNLANTPWNDLSAGEKTSKTKAAARFAKQHYAAASEVDLFCVVLMRQDRALIFTTTRSENACYPAKDL